MILAHLAIRYIITIMFVKSYDFLFSGFKPVFYFLLTPWVLIGMFDLNAAITTFLLKVFFGMSLFNLFVFYLKRKSNVNLAERANIRPRHIQESFDPSDPNSHWFSNDSNDPSSYNYSPEDPN